MAKNINYAAPGAHVGIQAGDVEIHGPIVISAGGIQIGGISATDDTPAIEEGDQP